MYNLLYLALTICMFTLCSRLYSRFRTPLLLPVLTSTFLIIIILVIFSVEYSDYYNGSHWLSELLGPAVVALAYPLYNNRRILLDNWKSIVYGTGFGFAIGFICLYSLSALLSVDHFVLKSMYPKSVTTPVAMEIARNAGGSPRLAALFVMVTGISGAMFAPFLFRYLRLTSPAARGIALGASSHAIGTSKAIEFGDEDAAFSSVAMAVSCLIASVWIPVWMLIMH
ncbi:LrgB family protein [Fictibacillus iocasae]|uniref:LrgB family protein n=1 Tax=Fictibacillus iocasae TaxID=2715437 RepID=A0ABW2NN71_9BACL